MKETSKCYELRTQKGYFEKYFIGDGIDIGGGDDTLRIENGSVQRWDKVNGDAQYLNNIENESKDFVYSSHCLEHMKDYNIAFDNWKRITKKSGYLVIAVPDYELYEKKILPSKFNPEHKWAFTLNFPTAGKIINVRTWLDGQSDIKLETIYLNTEHYNFRLPDTVDQTIGKACCQIDFVVKKL